MFGRLLSRKRGKQQGSQRNQSSQQGGIQGNQGNQENQEKSKNSSAAQAELASSLQQNLQQLKSILGNTPDLVMTMLKDGTGQEKVGVIYLDGLVGKEYIHYVMNDIFRYIDSLNQGGAGQGQSSVQNQSQAECTEQNHEYEKGVRKWNKRTRKIKNLRRDGEQNAENEQDGKQEKQKKTGEDGSASTQRSTTQLQLTIAGIKQVTQFNELVQEVLNGNTAILIENDTNAYLAPTSEMEHRAVEMPTAQNVVRGPHEGFTEMLVTNMSLVRRRLKTPDLRFELLKVGRLTQTDVGIIYLNSVAEPQLVDDVRKRIKQIDIDGILDSSYIEELIMDRYFTIFPTIFNTERPDTVVAGLLEGQVAILVDGTPYVLLAPTLFIQFIQDAEDYYTIGDYGFIRSLRFIAFFISLLFPALYVAFTTFHQEMLPTTLLISIAAQREGVPFPAVIEAIFMQITFEILREAGVRMPEAIGSAISIVGALVLGEAAVMAGVVSAGMVIVISLTAITTFMIPYYAMSFPIRVLRFGFIFLSATFGLFGIVMGLLATFLHLSHLRSFGVPYMSPLAPINLTDQKDTIFRFPLWMMNKRPHSYNRKNIIRQGQTSHSQNKNLQGKTKGTQDQERTGGSENT